jgi:hypothetical protein
LLSSPSRLAADAVDRGDATSVELTKKGVFEVTLGSFDAKGACQLKAEGSTVASPEKRKLIKGLCPGLTRLQEQWRDLAAQLNRSAGFLDLSQLFHFKVAKVRGGGFPAHFDTDPSTGRSLSMCLWLNQDWTPAQGGQLRVYPFPFDKEDVEPLAGRMCMFCSHQTLHRVMPASADNSRYCISMMFFGDPRPFPTHVPLPEHTTHLAPALLPLCSPGNARVLVFLLFEDECVRSIRESFVETDEKPRERAVSNFRKRLAVARRKLPKPVLDMLAQQLPLQS